MLAEHAHRWESASEADLRRVERVARAVVSRLLHQPTVRLKQAGGEHGHARAQVVRELFGLDEPAAEVRELPRRRQTG